MIPMKSKSIPDRFILVLKPTKDSEHMDIVYQATWYDLFLQIKGGLEYDDIAAILLPSEHAKAMRLGDKLLAARDAKM